MTVKQSSLVIFTFALLLVGCGDNVGGNDEVGLETGGPDELTCPANAKQPVIPTIDCDVWADESWGRGEWSNFAGTSVAPWDGLGEPPWEDWSGVEPCTASRPTSASHQQTGVLPIHAVHLPGGKIIMWEGRHDQHVWNFRTNTWEWYPLTSAAGNDCFTPEQLEEAGADPILALDLFCAGHALDADGDLVVSGGNLTGNAQAGAICSHVLPYAAYSDGSGAVNPTDGDLCPGDLANLVEPSFSPWLDSGNHLVPRWYPTLTTLPDGDILMTAGFTTGLPVGTFFERFDENGWNVAGSSGPLPLYPFMFVTPNGDLLFAGSESASETQEAQIFSRDENGFWQLTNTAPSPVRGGSAVMYEPGKVMKSGGGSRPVCAQTEGAPLAMTAVIDLTEPNMGFEDTGLPMQRRRHFHSLTLLPDGTVLASGGNSCGNGESNTGGNSCFADQNTLLECNEGDPECIPVISIPCNVKADCPDWATCGNTSTILDCPGGDCTCNPGNNACYATREAELWDPVSKRWCLMAEESFERMYHSTALLMPDGRVMSSGNGRRQGLTSWETAEFFSPPYLLNGAARPEVDAINGVAVPAAIPEVGWGGTVSVTLGAGIAFEDIGRVTLVRLGSVTHQNDMDQRFIDLGCFWPGRATPDGRVVVTVNGPIDANQAPPGHYMLFVLTEAGVPSVGHYVKIGE